MARELKVYGWTSHPPLGVEVPGRSHAHQQVRAIVAAASRKEALAAAGNDRPNSAWARDFVSVTGNEVEIRVATRKPGTLFMAPLYGSRDEQYVEIPKEAL